MMSNTPPKFQQDPIGQAPDAKENTLSPETAAPNIADREAMLHAKEQAATQRQATADQRQATADQRQATADQRQENADQRQEAADQRQENADQRQEAADQRQENADHQEEKSVRGLENAVLRQEAADLRQGAADLSKKEARAKAKLSAITEAHLREANERLVLATIRAQTMTEAAENATMQMSYMAQHDYLTGLPNRSLLGDRLAQAIAAAQRHGKHVALMYLDLDHFKHINDSLGHGIGDQLLRSAAKRLQACIPRRSDTVSRQGGDEFVVLLAEVNAVQDSVLAAKKMIEVMAEPHLIGGHRLHVTLSIGISLYPDDGRDAETLVRNADTAMYYAKNTGRNNCQLFTAAMNADAVTRRSVEDALHQGLEQDEFFLHYQPKVDLRTGTITGAEALVRLQSSDQPIAYPAEFVSVAENCGLILQLGKWVLGEACRQMAAWREAGLAIEQIAVNVSAAEFHSKSFLAGVRTVLDETSLEPHRLELEITESGLMQDTVPTTEILRELKKLGVQIAIDDFGTGYSSLSYLRHFPIDTLKIDQSFVKDIDGDSPEIRLVSAIIAMGKSLKLHVVAEGIETAQQLTFLQSRECAEGQGYYFNRPLPAKQFAALLQMA